MIPLFESYLIIIYKFHVYEFRVEIIKIRYCAFEKGAFSSQTDEIECLRTPGLREARKNIK
jgi:hypothetical protein